MDDLTVKCRRCSNWAYLECQVCFEPYCSLICQKCDWPVHKNICIPMPSLQPRELGNINVLFKQPPPVNHNGPTVTQRCATNLTISKLNSLECTRMVKSCPLANGSESLSAEIDNLKLVTSKKPENITPSNIKITTKTAAETANQIKCDISLASNSKTLSSEAIEQVVVDKSAVIKSIEPGTSTELPQKLTRKSLQKWQIPFKSSNVNSFTLAVITDKTTKPNSYWVMDKQFQNDSLKYLQIINTPKATYIKCQSDREIKFGEIYVVRYVDQLYYRCEVIEEKNPLDEFKVRLIDFGTEFYVKFTEMLQATLPMKTINCYAYPIKIQSEKVVNYEIDDEIEIKVVEALDNGFQIVLVKEISVQPKAEKKDGTLSEKVVDIVAAPEKAPPKKKHPYEDVKGIPFRIASINSFNRAVAILTDSQYEFIVRKCLSVDQSRLAATPPGTNFEIGEVVIAKLSETTWGRCMVVGHHKNCYVVFDLDFGQIELSSNLLKVPNRNEFIDKFTIMVVFIVIKSIFIDTLEFYENVFYDKAQLNHMKAEDDYFIVDENNKRVAQIDLQFWNLSINMLRECVSFWRPKIPLDSTVMITAISQDLSSMCITVDGKCGFYDQIFAEIGETLKPLANEPSNGQIVMVNTANGKYYRAIIIDNLKAPIYRVVNVDVGDEYDIDVKSMRAANNFVQLAPIYTMTIIHKVAGADDFIRNFIATRQKFIWMSVDGKTELVEPETNKTLSSLIEDVIKELEAKKSSSVSIITETNSDAIYLSSIDIHPIPQGKSIKIFCLDDTTIDKGYMTAAHVCPEFHQNLLQVSETVNKYCSSLPNHGYSPRENEVCLAKFKDDESWYRAYCVNVHNRTKPSTYSIMFLDYGNSVVETADNLRKMSPNLMSESFANICFLKEKVSAKDVDKLREFITKNDMEIVADEVIGFGGGYSISLASILAMIN